MRRETAAGAPAFCDIGIASNFSFLRGASSPQELVAGACRLDLAGIGLADRNTLAGVVRAYQAARLAKLAFAPGARLVFCDGTPDIFAYPRTRAGWGALCRLLTRGNLRTVKGDCRLSLDDVLEFGAEINLAMLCPDAVAGDGPTATAAAALVEARLTLLAQAFPRRVRLCLAPRHDGLDRRRLARAAAIAKVCGAALMATNDVFYHAPERRRLQDVVTAIREHVPVAQAGFLIGAHAERHLKSGVEMARLFHDAPEAIEEAGRFFRELAFDLKSLKYEYPDETSHLERSPAEELRRLALAGAEERYRSGVPQAVLSAIEHELAIIAHKQYEPYFLTVHAIVKEARRLGILCQGRGSAANSTVCFCLAITEVSPDRGSLLFERFISPERNEPPDIDIDFEHERREEIIQWIFEKYGRDNAALAATVITYRTRSAAREVGKAFGLSEDAVQALSGSIWGYGASDLGEREALAAGLSPKDETTAHVLTFASELSGFPRHLSQHVGGFVITRGRIDEVVPILNTGMAGRTVVEWDKDDLDELGILKIDILALGMLSCLRRGFDLLSAHYGLKLTLADLSMKQDDAPTYAMTRRADTLGVFQIESRAQMSMLPKLQPRTFYDFVIQVAIVRPGPIQGDMVHPYLKRRMGLEKVTYPKEELRAVLERTEGVPLFQEQAMKIAIVAAGFTPSEADQLRRAMASFRRSGTIQNFREKMVEGMVARGYERDFAERCFRQIEGFGEYGFPESHAASFALLVYASCWMKCHYPDVFCAALLNAQPMGFYAPAQIVRDARDHGVEIRAVDVNHSDWDCRLEKSIFDPAAIAPRHREMAADIETRHAVRLGFRQVKGLSEADMAALTANRGAGYDSVRDLWLRAGLRQATVERLADADAFASLGLTRREALWAAEALSAGSAAERLPLFETAGAADLQRERHAVLPPMPLGEEVINDYRFVSLSLKAHPVAFVRAALTAKGVIANGALPSLGSGRRVSVGGLVLVRQRPGSAKGVIFMTVEDETGIANLIVWPKLFEIFRAIVLGARFVRATGRMQSDHGVIHVVVDRIEDETPLLAQVAAGDAGSLAGVIARADEVRRPVDDARAHRRPLDRLRQETIETSRENGASLASRPPLQRGAAPPKSLRTVLPKGRNFQ